MVRQTESADALVSWRRFLGQAGLSAPLDVKLRPPGRREQWVERHRQLRMLSGTTSRLILVAAPAGWGKTVLVAQWDATLAGKRPCAWVSLDRGDNDPVRLWWHIICALQQACPGLGSAEGLRPPSAPPPELTGTVLPALARALAELAVPPVLVLDDYHLIRDRGCHEQIAFLLEHLPPSAQLVLITRADPPLRLYRLRAAGEMAEIRFRELCFHPHEAAELVRATAGMVLTDTDASTLTQWARGWPAAISLAALALRGHPDPARFVRRLARSQRQPADVAAEEFLARQSPVTQRFLRRTSVLDQFTAPLCDFVAETADSARILAELAQDNLFLVPLGDDKHWYSYHPLFAQLLRSQLARAEPGITAGLHRRASTWLTEHGSARLAISHAMAAGDTDAAVALIARFWRSFASVGRTATVWAWLGSLGRDRMRTDPVAAHCAAWTAIVSGDVAETRRWLRCMEATRLDGPLPDGMRSLAFSAALLRACGFDGLRVMRESAAMAAELEDDPRSPWYASARCSLGSSLYLSADLIGAAAALDQAMASTAADPPTRMFVLALAALVAVERDRLPQAHELAGAARQVMDVTGLAGTPHSTLVWTAIAAVHSGQGRLSEALPEFERARASRRQSPGISPWAPVVVLLRLTALLLDLGDRPAAGELLAEANSVVGALPGGAEALQPRFEWLQRRLASTPHANPEASS